MEGLLKRTCPECGGEIKEWDEAAYLPNGEIDQVVFRVCQRCKAEW